MPLPVDFSELVVTRTLRFKPVHVMADQRRCLAMKAKLDVAQVRRRADRQDCLD